MLSDWAKPWNLDFWNSGFLPRPRVPALRPSGGVNRVQGRVEQESARGLELFPSDRHPYFTLR